MRAAAADRAPPAGLAASVRRALLEDRVRSDRTTHALFPRPKAAHGVVTAQAPGTVAGLAVALAAARAQGLRGRTLVSDGATVRPGQGVLVLDGDLRRMLAVERTVLNFLMHLSGVATATARAVRAARRGHRGPEVLATRKTLPGLRDLEKWAVVLGGGRPHRRDLATGLLVKNNHLAAISIEEAVRRLRRAGRGRLPVEVEVRSSKEALRAIRAGADVILLDNRTPWSARGIVHAVERAGLRASVRIELSGGITPANVGAYRSVGADAVSLGAITHSASALPFHLTVTPRPSRRSRSP
ncbi:MAG: carboxylating nicotinate-nucleotide diphosphorylase [Thermoplasmata archaeon]|nr:carboxylating nicotinate-nucleotide diphosphorylase [Thermoplasmata archaeon]